MTLEELIKLYRAQAADTAEPYFCKDDLLTLYANEAQDEACRRGELLRDSTSALCTIAFASGAEAVPLDARIMRVLHARVSGQTVGVISGEVMHGVFPGWQDDINQGRPTHLVEGMTTGMLHLWPRPTEAGTIRLTVQRLPLKPLRNDIDKPEIRPELHAGLVEWMLHRVFSQVDAEVYDATKAALSQQRFEAEFGRKVSGRNEEWARRGAGLMPGPIA